MNFQPSALLLKESRGLFYNIFLILIYHFKSKFRKKLCRIRGHSWKRHVWRGQGDRKFEVLPYYGQTVAEICGLFDSVYIFFYKSIRGNAGAIPGGKSKDLTEESKI
ncbi:hypothetical protein PPM_p0138 (plasmid) [Paenibacillus polymyxa M1]|nr:hypothetical protein PPM_p0138 [Paenibacillus polymyxa M1]